MAITCISHSFGEGSGTSISFDHFSSGTDTALVVGVSYVPNTEISGVSYNGQPLDFIAHASESSNA